MVCIVEDTRAELRLFAIVHLIWSWTIVQLSDSNFKTTRPSSVGTTPLLILCFSAYKGLIFKILGSFKMFSMKTRTYIALSIGPEVVINDFTS